MIILAVLLALASIILMLLWAREDNSPKQESPSPIIPEDKNVLVFWILMNNRTLGNPESFWETARNERKLENSENKKRKERS